MNFPKELVWTDQHINRFWNYMANKPKADQKYFTYQNGLGIVNFLEFFTLLRGKRILDFGCGKGFLIDYFLKAEGEVWALDYSDESIKSVNEKFNGTYNWHGGLIGHGEKLPYDDNSFDVIVCVETIEHVHDQYLSIMFRELFRILKPGGNFLLTTPNDEVLEDNLIYCPSCEITFHRMQHVRNWSERSLKTYLMDTGFQVTFIKGVNFKSFQRRVVKLKSIFDLSPRKIFQLTEYSVYKFLATLGFRRAYFNYLLRKFNSGVHLAAIATKSNSF